jgi:DNA-binding transcriptional regulator YiaG
MIKVIDRHLLRYGWPSWAPLLDQAVLSKPSPLEPVEFRFLRERASWTASDVVQALGVSSNVTVSRWETGARRIPLPTERLFRLIVAGMLTSCPWRLMAERLGAPWRQTRGRLRIYVDPQESRYEYRWATPPCKLPKEMQRLFWDTNFPDLDVSRHADYIISRILEKGDLEDWNWLRWTYGDERTAAVTRENNRLDRKTTHLWQEVLLS